MRFNKSKDHGISNISGYNMAPGISWSSNRTGISEKKLFDLITYPTKELIKSTKIE